MTTQAMNTPSPSRELLTESAGRRMRVRRRSAATLASGQDHAAAPGAASPDRPDATREVGGVGGVGGARVLRRWSVTDLIARAGGAPRAMA
jgi:hypothetical protein